jgi:hypothetical protein
LWYTAKILKIRRTDMDEMEFGTHEEALQYLADQTGAKVVVAAEVVADEISSMSLYNLFSKDKPTVFLLDPHTERFEKAPRPSSHYMLSQKMGDTEEERNEILARGVRGYYFPKLNLLALYKVELPGRRGLRNPTELALRIVANNLKADPKTVNVMIIDDVYTTAAVHDRIASTQLNLLTSQEQVLEKAFDALEGEGWYAKNKDKEGDVSFSAAMRWLDEVKDLDEEDKEDMGYMQSIYGDGGMHRYFVDGFGNIAFSKMHCDHFTNKADEAEELGFDVV